MILGICCSLRKQPTLFLWHRHCFPCNMTSVERAQIQYWWCLTTHWVVLLIGRAAKEISFNQSEVLPRSELLCNLGTPWQSIGWQINWLVDQTPSTRGWVSVVMWLSILNNMLAIVSADTWRKRWLTWVLSVDMLAGMLTNTPSIFGWYVGRNLVQMFLWAVGGTAEGWWPIDQYVNQHTDQH